MSKKLTPHLLQAEVGRTYNNRKIIAFDRIEQKTTHPKRNKYYFTVECLNCGDAVCIELYGIKKNTCLCMSHRDNANFSVEKTHKALRKQIFNSYKNRAKYKNWKFDLSEQEFYKLMDSRCFYCNTKPINELYNWSRKTHLKYNGVDRLDSHNGYTKNNTVTCCGPCNRAKNDSTLEEFFIMCTKVVQNLMAKKYFDNFDKVVDNKNKK